MDYTKEEIEAWKEKAKKWDSLDSEIEKCYGDYDDDNEELPSEFEEEHGEEPDLCTIGEMAASAFGYL